MIDSQLREILSFHGSVIALHNRWGRLLKRRNRLAQLHSGAVTQIVA